MIDDEALYTLCIDGGGSKTSLQILDKLNRKLAFRKKGESTYEGKAGSSNLTTIGAVGVEQAFHDLLDDVEIDEQSLKSISDQCKVIGGFAGVASPDSISNVKKMIAQWGFKRIEVDSDIGLLSRLIEDNGIVLIAGTGSICFGKHGDRTMRVGGLGRYLGDEGSGYHIGKSAIKACLEQEHGYGEPTDLNPELCRYFELENMKQLIRPFYAGDVMPEKVAGVAPLVFEKEDSDSVAREIIAGATSDLAKMLRKMIQKLTMKPSQIYLVGGSIQE